MLLASWLFPESTKEIPLRALGHATEWKTSHLNVLCSNLAECHYLLMAHK